MPNVDGFHETMPSISRPGMRRARTGRASCSSARASDAPRQWWMPEPNVRCWVALRWVMSKVSGESKGCDVAVGRGKRDKQKRPLRKDHVTVFDVFGCHAGVRGQRRGNASTRPLRMPSILDVQLEVSIGPGARRILRHSKRVGRVAYQSRP